jgi:hypothetical protein
MALQLPNPDVFQLETYARNALVYCAISNICSQTKYICQKICTPFHVVLIYIYIIYIYLYLYVIKILRYIHTYIYIFTYIYIYVYIVHVISPCPGRQGSCWPKPLVRPLPGGSGRFGPATLRDGCPAVVAAAGLRLPLGWTCCGQAFSMGIWDWNPIPFSKTPSFWVILENGF